MEVEKMRFQWMLQAQAVSICGGHFLKWSHPWKCCVEESFSTMTNQSVPDARNPKGGEGLPWDWGGILSNVMLVGSVWRRWRGAILLFGLCIVCWQVIHGGPELKYTRYLWEEKPQKAKWWNPASTDGKYLKNLNAEFLWAGSKWIKSGNCCMVNGHPAE